MPPDVVWFRNPDLHVGHGIFHVQSEETAGGRIREWTTRCGWRFWSADGGDLRRSTADCPRLLRGLRKMRSHDPRVALGKVRGVHETPLSLLAGGAGLSVCIRAYSGWCRPELRKHGGRLYHHLHRHRGYAMQRGILTAGQAAGYPRSLLAMCTFPPLGGSVLHHLLGGIRVASFS